MEASTARRLDELAQATGRKVEDVITSLIETAPPPSPSPDQLCLPELARDEAISPDIGAPPRPEPLELPEESMAEQIIGKTLWNVEQAERNGKPEADGRIKATEQHAEHHRIEQQFK